MSVNNTRYTIGRDGDCDVSIADDSVSRVHAEVTIDGGRVRVTDRKSRNGTRLIRNQQTTGFQDGYVVPTDQLQFGEAMLSVADILEAIRSKHPQVLRPENAPARPLKAVPGRLSRCECGFVKPQDQTCPECGR